MVLLSRAWVQRTILPAMAWEPATLVNPGVLAVAAAATLVTAFAAGISPLWYVVHDALPTVQGRILDTPGRRPRLQGGLLATQGALSVILLVGAGLFLRSLHNATTLDIGLDRDNVLAVRVDFTGTGRSPDDVARFYESALDNAATIPGVARASLAMSIPLRMARGGGFRLPGSEDMLTTPSGAVPFVNYVTPGFFETTGMRIRKGRGFLEAERAQGQVMVVNETLARLAWPHRSAVGECVYRFDQEACTTVVGVVADARRFRLVGEEPHPYFYELLASDDTDPRALLVRMAPGQSRLHRVLRQEITALDAGVPFVQIETLGEALDPQIRPSRLGASLFTVFGLLAVLLAAIGLWSSVSYAVAQRKHEFAVRLAVGASPGGLVRLVLKDGLRTALVASAAGLMTAAVRDPPHRGPAARRVPARPRRVRGRRGRRPCRRHPDPASRRRCALRASIQRRRSGPNKSALGDSAVPAYRVVCEWGRDPTLSIFATKCGLVPARTMRASIRHSALDQRVGAEPFDRRRGRQDRSRAAAGDDELADQVLVRPRLLRFFRGAAESPACRGGCAAGPRCSAGVSPRDPTVFAAVVLAVATLASLWPALCASRVNPAEALRAE